MNAVDHETNCDRRGRELSPIEHASHRCSGCGEETRWLRAATCAIPQGVYMTDPRNTAPSPTLFHWDAVRDGWARAEDNAFVSKAELTAFEKTSRTTSGADLLRSVRLQARLELALAARGGKEVIMRLTSE